MKFLAKFLSFFPRAIKPAMPVVELTPKQLQAQLPVAFEGYKPAPGMEWNPLTKWPRNDKCFCGSGIKAKNCCLPSLPLATDKDLAEAAAPLVRQYRSAN